MVPYAMYTALRTPAANPGSRLRLDQMLERSALLRRLAQVNHIRAASVFGSVARRSKNWDSDVDLLVEPDDEATLSDLAQFASDVELLLGRHVDVVSRAALDPARPGDRRALDEAVAL